MTDVWLKIEEPGGPGLDLRWEADRGLVVEGVRPDHGWLGFDRAVVAETDAGDGSSLPAVVALPFSAPAGSSVRATLIGAFREGHRTVIAARHPQQARPISELLRVAARVGQNARELDEAAAREEVRRARDRYLRRRAAGRRTDRPAWLPVGLGAGRVVGAGQSAAERGLAALPPRFVRGLRDLLDDDERILAAAEREADERVGILPVRRPWSGRDRRAALLVLTDRQLLWLVDHVEPDRYLLDWGVDASLLPLEAIRGLQTGEDGGITVDVGGHPARFGLRPDAARELDHLVRRLGRFTAPEEPGAVRRHYPIEATELDLDTLEPFHQVAEAGDRLAALRATAGRPLLASFYAPRRERVRHAVAVALTHETVLVDDGRQCRELPLGTLRPVRLAISPLIGRIELQAGERRARFSYPAPLSPGATAFVRQLRRAWANVG